MKIPVRVKWLSRRIGIVLLGLSENDEFFVRHYLEAIDSEAKRRAANPESGLQFEIEYETINSYGRKEKCIPRNTELFARGIRHRA